MIWIIGGTTESGKLADFLKKEKKDYIMSAATEESKDFFKNHNLKIGRMDKTAMEKFCTKEGINLIADLSHPYAVEVSQNAKKVSEHLNIKYLRFIRKTSDKAGWVDEDKAFKHFKNMESLCVFLKKLKSSTVFFTTGSKTICEFEPLRRTNRFVYRILPTVDSLEKCKQAGVPTQDIAALTGPFSQTLNEAMFKEYTASYVVMKDSGEAGGTKEKLAACANLKIEALIIDRQEDTGIYDFDRFKKEVLLYGHA